MEGTDYEFYPTGNTAHNAGAQPTGNEQLLPVTISDLTGTTPYVDPAYTSVYSSTATGTDGPSGRPLIPMGNNTSANSWGASGIDATGSGLGSTTTINYAK